MDDLSKMILYQTEDEKVALSVKVDGDTVWLNRIQMSELFNRDVKTIGKHIQNAMLEELKEFSTVAYFATVQMEGTRSVERMVEYYSLDMIISVGYRVKSSRGVEFRRWANGVLKSFILKGYAANHERLQELNQVIRIMKRSDDRLESTQILDVISNYIQALDLLDDYDHQRIKKPVGNNSICRICYQECRNIIDSMRFNLESDLFGQELNDSFHSSINAIYQTFDDVELYPSVEEKAANLLYFITKNHSFADGNKRIAAVIFLHFLSVNQILYQDNRKIIADHTLVAITLMLAESNPEEKETMIRLIMNFLI